MDFDRCGARARTLFALLTAALIAGCGGGGDQAAADAPPPPPAAAPAPTVGAAGGTVSSAEGAAITVPAGALTGDVAIAVQAAPNGAPPLPPGLLALGKVFAFTPHGTTFATPATVSVPFDPAWVPGGVTPVLYKADGSGSAATEWRVVSGATVQGAAMSAPISSFSYLVVAPPLEFIGVWRSFYIKKLYRFAADEPQPEDLDSGELNVVRDLDGLLGSEAEIYASATGATYWSRLTSPVGPRREDAVGAELVYSQHQFFRKRDDEATLRFTITAVTLLGQDYSSRPMECRNEGMNCRKIAGRAALEVVVFDEDLNTLFDREGMATLQGLRDSWSGRVNITTDVPLWEARHFEGGLNSVVASMSLREPLHFEVPLQKVKRNKWLVVEVRLRLWAIDRRQAESRMGAYLRDPQQIARGVQMEFSGLDRADPRGRVRPTFVRAPAPACPGAPDPAAGTLQIEKTTFTADEHDRPGAEVTVTRTGGTRGRVSARLSTRGGTAVPGRHYTAVASHVAFADGYDGQRTVFVPLLPDEIIEPDRTVGLVLDDVRGCAALGDITDATLTIFDDDSEPAPPPTYRVGGTVTGLAGSGLVLEDSITSDSVAPTADGVFTLAYPYTQGSNYNLRVRTQPRAPDQTCSVRNGSGTVGMADVTDIAVECVNVAPAGALDLSFGSAGKVYVDDIDAGTAVVVQPSGRIVALAGMTLAAFDRTGNPDPTFGTGGRVALRFNGGLAEEAYGMIGQPDGKLIVVGRARVGNIGNLYDMAIARFEPDGAPDLGFGARGLTTVNPARTIGSLPGIVLGSAFAHKALLGADGKIWVAGMASYFDRSSSSNRVGFAVVRLNADGTVDATYGRPGEGNMAQLRSNPFTLVSDPDLAYAIGVQSDGKAVLGGSAENSSFGGLVRFKAAGWLDSDDPRVPENYGLDGSGTVLLGSFGSYTPTTVTDLVMLADDHAVLATFAAASDPGPIGVSKIMLVRIGPKGTTRDALAVPTPVGPGNDVPGQLLRQRDGKLLLAAQISSAATVADFGILRYNADLTLDATFGGAGVVLVDFFGARDAATALAVQTDGKIVATGSVRNGRRNGFGLLRLEP